MKRKRERLDLGIQLEEGRKFMPQGHERRLHSPHRSKLLGGGCDVERKAYSWKFPGRLWITIYKP